MSTLPASSSGMSIKQSLGAETNIMVRDGVIGVYIHIDLFDIKLFVYQQHGMPDEHGPA